MGIMTNQAFVLKDGPAEDVAMSSVGLARTVKAIRAWTEGARNRGAAICVARAGVVVLHAGFGESEFFGMGSPAPRPVGHDTIFVIASPTKPVTAACVGLLIDRGQVLLCDPVSEFIPEYGGEDRRHTEILHLMTHTCGLPSLLPEDQELAAQSAPLSMYVERTCLTPVLYPPGTDCRYSCLGILLLGEVVERLEGISLRAFMARELFEPLGMHDSYLGWGQLDRGRIACPDLPRAERAKPWNVNSDYWRDLGVPWGGLHATVRDYAALLQTLLNGGCYGSQHLFSPALARTMVENHICTMPAIPPEGKWREAWGLGWRLNQPRGAHGFPELASSATFGHHGATGTTAWADPVTGLVCTLFTNQPSAGRFLGLVSNLVAAAVAE